MYDQDEREDYYEIKKKPENCRYYYRDYHRCYGGYFGSSCNYEIVSILENLFGSGKPG